MVSMTTELIRYDAMCRAIADAYDVDEVKDLRDKALAIEMYARQAKNVEAERQACEIRLRAERRWGQLRKTEVAPQGRPKTSRPTTFKTLNELGVSRDQSSRWQGLADIDDDTFEEAVTKPGASTTGILADAHQHPVDLVSKEALWLWGRLQAFDREGILDQDPATICETMMPHMLDTVRELLPQVIGWLQGVEPCLKNANPPEAKSENSA